MGIGDISPALANSPPLPVKSGSTVTGAADARAREMAIEMEATFLSMLLKEMRQTLDSEEGGLFPGDTGDVHGGLFDLYLSRHLADSGGVGLAVELLRQMQAAKPVAPTTDAHSKPATTGGNAPSAPRT